MTNGVTLERSVSGGLRQVLTDRKLIAGGRGTIDFDRGAEKDKPRLWGRGWLTILIPVRPDAYCCCTAAVEEPAAFRACAFSASTLWALSSRAWASGRKVSAFWIMGSQSARVRRPCNWPNW